MEWQALEAKATVWIAVATIVAALGAIAAAIFALVAIGENRKANRTRLTVDLFDSHNTTRLTKAVRSVAEAYGSLTLARTNIGHKIATRTLTPQERETATQDVCGVLAYAAALYESGVLDKRLFRSRASEFIASAFYIYEPMLAEFLRTGVLERNVVTLGQECLTYRNKVPRNFDAAPELQTYCIPPDFGS